MRNVAILIFDGVDMLDFCGPFEVFWVTGMIRDGLKPFNVYTVAEKSNLIMTHDIRMCPQYTFLHCPQPDILVVPGGSGARREMHNTIEWIIGFSQKAELVLSVCTGALLLAKAGLLEGLTATTHHKAIEELKAVAHNTNVIQNKRFVDNGKIITSAGISTGIDASLHVIAKLLGKEQALKTAKYIEYEWEPDS